MPIQISFIYCISHIIEKSKNRNTLKHFIKPIKWLSNNNLEDYPIPNKGESNWASSLGSIYIVEYLGIHPYQHNNTGMEDIMEYKLDAPIPERASATTFSFHFL